MLTCQGAATRHQLHGLRRTLSTSSSNQSTAVGRFKSIENSSTQRIAIVMQTTVEPRHRERGAGTVLKELDGVRNVPEVADRLRASGRLVRPGADRPLVRRNRDRPAPDSSFTLTKGRHPGVGLDGLPGPGGSFPTRCPTTSPFCRCGRSRRASSVGVVSASTARTCPARRTRRLLREQVLAQRHA